MKGFEISPDCMLEKSAKAIARELIKGSFVIGCDYKNKQLVFIIQKVREGWRFIHCFQINIMRNVN